MAGFGVGFGEDFGGVGASTPPVTPPVQAPAQPVQAPTSANPYTPIQIPLPPWSAQVPGVDIPRVDVYTGAFVLVGQVAKPVSLYVEDCFKAAGVCRVDIAGDLDAEIAAAFEDPSARVVVTLRGVVIFSGQRQSARWVGPEKAPTLTVTCVDDYSVLTGILAWPIPANALNAQSTARWTTTAVLETAVKALVTANVAAARLNLPVTVETTAGRGASVTISARMQPLSDYIQPLLDQYNKGLKVRQSGAGLLVSWVEPASYPETMSEIGGQIVPDAWELEETNPLATRVIVGGQGEGTAREFVQRTNTTVETAVAWKREAFIDARDTNVTAELNARGDAALVEGGAKLSARVPLQETPEFQCYTDGGVKPGDLVPIELMGRSWTATIRQVTTMWDTQNGLLVEPIAGDLDNTAAAVSAHRTATLQRRVRALESSR